MRQKSKKLLSVLLALVLLAGLVPGLTPGMSLTALAADGSETFDSFQRGVNEYRGTHIKCVSTDAFNSAAGGLYVGGSSNDTITVSSLNGEIITKVEITNSFPTDTIAYDIGNVVIDGAAKTVDGIKSATFSNLNVSSAVIKTEGGAIGIWVSSVKVYYSEPVAVPHEHDGVSFQPWDSATSLPVESGNYYLTQDVRLSSGLQITGSEINLCLNGHTISTSFSNGMISTIPSAIWLKSGAVLRIYDEGGGTIRNNSSKPVSKGGAIHVETGCTLHLYGGAISGYRAEWGGGVIVYGTMYMYGGEITGNTATSGGGGIELEKGGTLYLYGGSVTGNNVADRHSDLYKGGGIHVPSGSAFHLKGSVTVRDNTDGSGAANNVFLRSGLVITVAGQLTNTTPIGVLTQEKIESGVKSIPLTSVLNGDGAASNFVSDDSAYKVILENDRACLVSSADEPAAADYTITIPETLTVANAGWNATAGIKVDGNLGGKTLTVTAASTNNWALKSGGNAVGYNLAKANGTYSAGAAVPTWTFTETGTQDMGVIVEGYSGKPAGDYEDIVTFTATLGGGSAAALEKLTIGDLELEYANGDDWTALVNRNSGKIAFTDDGIKRTDTDKNLGVSSMAGMGYSTSRVKCADQAFDPGAKYLWM